MTGVNDAPVVSAASVDSAGHIAFTITDPDNSSFTLVNTPSGIAAAFGNPTLSLGSNNTGGSDGAAHDGYFRHASN